MEALPAGPWGHPTPIGGIEEEGSLARDPRAHLFSLNLSTSKRSEGYCGGFEGSLGRPGHEKAQVLKSRGWHGGVGGASGASGKYVDFP